MPVFGIRNARVLNRVRLRRSVSRASSCARCRARSDRPPSSIASSRHAIRRKRYWRFAERFSSPNSSTCRLRSCFTVIRRRAAVSIRMSAAMDDLVAALLGCNSCGS